MYKLFSLLLALLITGSCYASFLKNVPQKLKQPDGTLINCFASGDEYYNWLHDAEGYTIIQHPKTGYYTYALLQGDQLVASDFIVGEVQPAQVGLTTGNQISASKRMEIRRKKTVHRKHASFFKNFKEAQSKESGNMTRSAFSASQMNNIAIYIRFADQEEFELDHSRTERFFNVYDEYTSLQEYFLEASHGQLFIETTFYPVPNGTSVISYQDNFPTNYYLPYNEITNPEGYPESTELANELGVPTEREREAVLLKKAIEYVESQIPQELDLDLDNDNYVDHVTFIVQGGGGSWGALLWSHKFELNAYESVSIHGVKVDVYNFIMETQLDPATICHEMGHSLGAPDLYRYNDKSITPIGSWDIMASAGYALEPNLASTYTLSHYWGFNDEIPTIWENGNYELEPSTAMQNNAYRIETGNPMEYFVVEYRPSEAYMYTSGSGLAIFRVNRFADGNSQGPIDELYVYRPEGSLYENGQIEDALFNDTFGRSEFSVSTDPAPFLSDGSVHDLLISNISTAGFANEEKISFTYTNTQSDYCAAQPVLPDANWPFPPLIIIKPIISLVEVGGASFTNLEAASGYFDFSQEEIALEPGVAYPFKLTPSFDSSPIDTYFRVWVDYDKNFSFNNEEELVYEGVSEGGSTLEGVLNTLNTASGATRLRVSISNHAEYYPDWGPQMPCEIFTWGGQVLDYTLNFGTDTSTPSEYCETGAMNSANEWIATVEMGDFTDTNSDNASGYYDQSSKVISLQAGASHAVGFSGGFSRVSYSERFSVWIDYNQDNDFDDAGELVFEGNARRGAKLEGDFIVPSDASSGNTRVRISMSRYADGAPAPCGEFLNGQTIDYTANISNSLMTRQNNVGDNAVNGEFMLATGFEMYPNPAVDKKVQIRSLTESESLANLKLYSSAGLLIYQEEVVFQKKETKQLNLSRFNSGLYHLLIEKEGTIESFKLIIK